MENNTSYYVIIIVVLLVLLVLSAFFAVCETAFTSLNRIKLKNLAAKGKKEKFARRAKIVLKLLDSYDSLLSSILIGNTIVSVSLSALATVLFIGFFGSKGVSLAALIMTLLVLIFGEITPKTLAKESPETTALRCVPLMRFFILLLKPFNYFAGAWKNIIIRFFPVNASRSATEDELLTFVEEVRQEGGISTQEEKMIRQAIEFDDITAAEICTPRIDLAAVSEDATAEDIGSVFAETGFSRLPVYRKNIDNITGVILLKDFHHEAVKKGRPPPEILKPVIFASKTIKISGLLRTLQKKQSHMAVLVDEFGGTVGIVTMEDIIEELVGEIWDEHDEVVEPFKRNEDESFSVLGSARLQDMLDFIRNSTGRDTDEKTNDGAGTLPGATVGNWVMENFNTLPRTGEQFNWRNLRIKVSRVQRHRVMEVLVTVSG